MKAVRLAEYHQLPKVTEVAEPKITSMTWTAANCADAVFSYLDG
jgi:hypothetical protein